MIKKRKSLKNKVNILLKTPNGVRKIFSKFLIPNF